MVKELDIVKYRKLVNIKIQFSNSINILAGTNGTCKSSLLHMVSNSYQAPVLKDDPSYKVIKDLNKLTNPKIESLTRDQKHYNDPAVGVNGTLFSAEYFNGQKINFRRHNSEKDSRFSLKPFYHSNKKEALPQIPVIYLGLFRLYAFGEFEFDTTIKKIANTLPDINKNLLIDLYEQFTRFRINLDRFNKMGEIKKRPEFTTNREGIDSNTISAGEDNLFIILLALVSLKNYYEQTSKEGSEISGILLIDEFDASLHPAFQVKLFKLLQDYSDKYKIQVIFTTHSLTLLKEINLKKVNLIYLIDNVDYVSLLPDPNYYTIDTLLTEMTRSERYLDNSIPVLTEDNEARIFLDLLLINFREKYKDISGYFHIVDASFSSETLKKLSTDDKLLRSTMRSINILDGDQHSQININNHLIAFPGKLSPEELAFAHADKLEREFWENSVLINEGFTKSKYLDIKKKIDDFKAQLQASKDLNNSNKGKKREFNKGIFNDYCIFWKFVLKDWIQNNSKECEEFYKNLNILYKKTAAYHGLSPDFWDLTIVDNGQND